MKRQSNAIRPSTDQLAALQTQYDAGMARAEATWDMVDEQLRTAALEVDRARHARGGGVGRRRTAVAA